MRGSTVQLKEAFAIAPSVLSVDGSIVVIELGDTERLTECTLPCDDTQLRQARMRLGVSHRMLR